MAGWGFLMGNFTSHHWIMMGIIVKIHLGKPHQPLQWIFHNKFDSVGLNFYGWNPEKVSVPQLLMIDGQIMTTGSPRAWDRVEGGLVKLLRKTAGREKEAGEAEEPTHALSIPQGWGNTFKHLNASFAIPIPIPIPTPNPQPPTSNPIPQPPSPNPIPIPTPTPNLQPHSHPARSFCQLQIFAEHRPPGLAARASTGTPSGDVTPWRRAERRVGRAQVFQREDWNRID